ncbi:hypothetical protein DYB28_005262 [Aphanomyces astaci]|uniref:Uncharacterized protein n=1 Tax=Aphanomyces astaci TaxID=112090 RepID=A0A9X8HC77_APHAT|nr:hypothetical protein DYB28_005262 [Aphanomyces astaci]
MGKPNQAQLKWTDDLDLALLREVVRVPASLSLYSNQGIPRRSARDHYDGLVQAFKATDKSQRQWGTGSDEDVPEKVQLLQDLVDQRDATDTLKTAVKSKDKKGKESLESTGSQLCVEAEQRVSKRQRPMSAKREQSDAMVDELLEFEKKKQMDHHRFRMERLEFDREEQQLRKAQMAENAQHGALLEKLFSASEYWSNEKVTSGPLDSGLASNQQQTQTQAGRGVP